MQNRVFAYCTELLVLLSKESTWDQANRYLDPLSWYINTGRASTEFLRRLLATKPYLIARRLMKGGTYDEVLKRIFALLDYYPV